LHFNAIPQHVDEHLGHLRRWEELDLPGRRNSPLHFIHHEQATVDPTQIGFHTDLSFNTIVNLVSVLGTDDREMIWAYLLRHRPNAELDRELLDRLITSALAVFRERILPTRVYALPDTETRPAVECGWVPTKETMGRRSRAQPTPWARQWSSTYGSSSGRSTDSCLARRMGRAWGPSSGSMEFRRPSRSLVPGSLSWVANLCCATPWLHHTAPRFCQTRCRSHPGRWRVDNSRG